MGNWAKQAKQAWSQRNYVQAGDFFKLDGNYRSAIKAYVKGRDFARAAKIHESLGNLDKARKLLEREGSAADLADFYKRNGETEKAISVYINNKMEYDAAELLEDLNKPAEAAIIYERLKFHEKAGILFGKAKNYGRAIDNFQRLLSVLEPQTGPNITAKKLKYLVWIANLHLGAKNYNQAGEIFENINQKEKAAKSYLKGDQMVKAARLFRDLGDKGRAKDLLMKVKDLEARAMLGQIAMEDGNFQEAATLLKDTGHNDLLCQAYERLGRFKDAAFYLEKGGDLRSAAAMYSKGKDYLKAAMLYEQQGFYAEAAHNYEKLKKYGSAAKLYHMAKNRFKAGYCLYKNGNLEDALQQLQHLDPDGPDALEINKLKAEIFFKLGKYPVARNLLESITSEAMLDDQSMTYFYLLARCLEAEGVHESARKYYERIMARRVGFADVETRLERLQRHSPNKGQTMPMSKVFRDSTGPKFNTGDLIADRFRILLTLGKGGMGFIYKVRDLSLDRDIALKMLIHERGNFEELKKELITARDLTHTYIIKVFDIGEWMGIGYFTMEYVEGLPLKQYIHGRAHDPITQKIKLLIKICEGLHAAHEQGVIHRDIKPQNIIIDQTNTPKILDFGIARRVSQTQQERSVSGSPKYMSPEQIKNLVTDARTDIYAMGIIMFYMFTLKEPFVARTAQEILMMQLERQLPEPTEFNTTIPFWLAEIIKRCCHKNREMRFGSMAELIEELKLNLI